MSADIGFDRIFDHPQLSIDHATTYLTLVRSMVDRANVVVDVGCGRGSYADRRSPQRHLFDLRDDTRTVIGIDVDKQASTNPFIDEFRLITPDLRWPIDDESADMVVSDWTLEHVADPAGFAAELTRVLRPGGVFVARTVNRYSVLSLAARTVPNKYHRSWISRLQSKRESIDVFPTQYTINTEAAATAALGDAFQVSVIFMTGLEAYVQGWAPWLAKVCSYVERVLPRRLHTVLIIVARRTAH